MHQKFDPRPTDALALSKIAEFSASLKAHARTWGGDRGRAFHAIIEENEKIIACAGHALIDASLGHLIQPVRDLEESFAYIPFGIFDHDGNAILDRDDAGTIYNATKIIMGLIATGIECSDPEYRTENVYQLAIDIGEFYLALQLNLSGLGGVMQELERLQGSTDAMTAVRSKGGKGRGEQLKEKANLWKAEAIKAGLKIREKHPEYSRSKMAQEIAFQIDDPSAEYRTPGIKQLENWLKDEAEEPNGPIKRRQKIGS